VHKEAALLKFRLLIQYENPSCEEVAEVEAQNSSDARDLCSSVMLEYGRRDAFLESMNVYCSRRVVACRLAPRTRQEELQALDFLKYDV